MSLASLHTWSLVLASVLAVGCGGNVTVGNPGGGGAGDGGGGTSTGTSTTGTTTTTGAPCDDHVDCPKGLCVFSSGVCSTACDFVTPCGTGQICDQCATASCPSCKNCVAACVPAPAGQCDDHDDCASGSVCLFGAQKCAPSCDANGGCADPNLKCDPCATSSCPACENCLGACLGP